MNNFARTGLSFWRTMALVVTAGTMSVFAPASVMAIDDPGAPAASPAISLASVTQRSWSQARSSGELEAALRPIRELVSASDDPSLAKLKASLSTLDANIIKREQSRTDRLNVVNAKLDALIAAPMDHTQISKALRYAVELHMLSIDKKAALNSPSVQRLIRIADEAARGAESKGDWLMSAELFGRLNLLLEEEQTYKADSRRLGDRLSFIRLYTPKRLWEMRNNRRLEEKLPPLSAYNPSGEDFNEKLRGVNSQLLLSALTPAAQRHVERTTMRTLLLGGLDAVRTLVTTHDLDEVFPGIADADARRKFLTFLDEQSAKLQDERTPVSNYVATSVIDRLLNTNDGTVKVPEAALIHEFGNGAYDKLDEYSQIIWPDELARFRRLTDGAFYGVGVQIQMDEETQMVKVITPLEGTPAQRAGLKAGDLIKKVNDKSAIGMSIDQVIEQITGREGTPVQLTVERAGADVVFDLARARIPITTAKGWVRTGNKETDWDWFVDKSNHIGYIRLSGFNDSSAAEVRSAIDTMKAEGLNGLVFDLRFNPGGLMDQAVSIVNMFINEGLVVYTEGPDHNRMQTENAQPGRVKLAGIPSVILINDNSASASEIVSGALRHYADQGKINAIVLGDRSFGKGSVQNVFPVGPAAQAKLTTQYYFLPNGNWVHKRPKSTEWGVIPHLKVEMLPREVANSLTIRIEADLPDDAIKGKDRVKKDTKPKDGDDDLGPDILEGGVDPSRLLTEPLDIQLQAALVLLQAQAISKLQAQAEPPAVKPVATTPG